MTLFLLRHAETLIMRTHLAGRAPGVSLSPLGIFQAEALARRVPPVSAIFSSPVQRAIETGSAVACAQHLELQVREDFVEFDFGNWTGLSFEKLQDDSHWHEFNHARELARAPGGESMSEVQHRAVEAVRRIAATHESESVAVVTHADVIRALILYAAGTTIRNYWRFTVNAASITEMAWGVESDERIVRINDCAHLEGLRA